MIDKSITEMVDMILFRPINEETMTLIDQCNLALYGEAVKNRFEFCDQLEIYNGDIYTYEIPIG